MEWLIVAGKKHWCGLILAVYLEMCSSLAI